MKTRSSWQVVPTVSATVIADLKNSAMAHLPSGDFNANAAWLALAALAHNLTRALATLAGHGLHHATTATIRRTLIAVSARLVRSARKRHHHELRGAVGWWLCQGRLAPPCHGYSAPLGAGIGRPACCGIGR